MSQIGLINIIRTAPPEVRRGPGILGGLAALTGLGALLVGAYRVADAALRGIAASTAEANRVAGWAVTVVLVVAALTAAVWLLLDRRRALRDAPVIAEFTVATDRALAAHHQRIAVEPPRPTPIATPTPQRVTAVRLDRIRSQP